MEEEFAMQNSFLMVLPYGLTVLLVKGHVIRLGQYNHWENYKPIEK